MNKVLNIVATLITVFAFTQVKVSAQTRERSEVPEKYKWKLEDLYPSDQAWNEAKQNLVAQFDEITQYQGKLGSSPSKLLACLEFDGKVSKEFGRLYSYAHMKSDEDTGNSKYLAMEQEMQQLGTDYNSKAAFITPEIAKLDKETIDRFI
jgi:oligoendopeptidase F